MNFNHVDTAKVGYAVMLDSCYYVGKDGYGFATDAPFPGQSGWFCCHKDAVEAFDLVQMKNPRLDVKLISIVSCNIIVRDIQVDGILIDYKERRKYLYSVLKWLRESIQTRPWTGLARASIRRHRDGLKSA